MMFSKPRVKKHKKPLSNPIPTNQDFCSVCGMPYSSLHEAIAGKNRQLSIKYGLQVRLCWEHHLGNSGAHKNKAFNDELKAQMKTKFLENHTEEEFLRIFMGVYNVRTK